MVPLRLGRAFKRKGNDMQWLSSNWIWIAVIAAIFAMHRFGHGGHRHGSGYGYGHAHGSRRSEAGWSSDRLGEARPASASDDRQTAHVGHARDAVGQTSSVPAAPGAGAHAEQDDRQAVDGRRRHRHGC
jgi:hypothetical protein